MKTEEFLQWAKENGFVKIPTGWHVVPEHATERQMEVGRQATSDRDKYRRQVLSAPKLPGLE